MKNDLKAPRFNPRKYRHNIVSEELWKSWREKTGRKESFKKFKEVWHHIAQQIIDTLIEEQDGFRLPRGLGDLYIGYIPRIKKVVPDYKTSLQYGKLIKHENWDTMRKVAKIIYGTQRRKYTYRLGRYWAFKGCRNFTRSVSEAIFANPERYKNSIEKRSGK